MHFSLLSPIGQTVPETTILTGRTKEDLETLPTVLDEGTVFGECYNTYTDIDNGECTQYFLNVINTLSVIIDQIDIGDSAGYTVVEIDIEESLLDQVVADERARVIYTNVLEHLSEFECPQYDDMSEVKDILNKVLGLN